MKKTGVKIISLFLSAIFLFSMTSFPIGAVNSNTLPKLKSYRMVEEPSSEYGYKNCPFNLNGQLLHAEKLEFIHPRNGEKMSFSAPIPDYFQKVLSVLERKSKKEK